MVPGAPAAAVQALRRLAALALASLAGLAFLPDAGAATRVACVGDSTTAGSGNSGVNIYPPLLARILGAGFEVKNFGDAGTTLMKKPGAGGSYWDTPAFKASQSYAPDVVLIMLGTNDSKAANWRGGNNSFEADYRALIATYAALASKPAIYALTPLPLFTTRSTLDPAVVANDIPAILRKVVADTGARLIDMQAAFLPDPKKYFGAGDGVDIGDGTHPNKAGAERIAVTVASVLTTAEAPDAGIAPADAPPAADAALAADAPPAPDAFVSPSADAAPPVADMRSADHAPPREVDASSSAAPEVIQVQTGVGACTLGGRSGAPAALFLAVVALAALLRRRGRR
jgi:lysophospholipase L1-like esterase